MEITKSRSTYAPQPCHRTHRSGNHVRWGQGVQEVNHSVGESKKCNVEHTQMAGGDRSNKTIVKPTEVKCDTHITTIWELSQLQAIKHLKMKQKSGPNEVSMDVCLEK